MAMHDQVIAGERRVGHLWEARDGARGARARAWSLCAPRRRPARRLHPRVRWRPQPLGEEVVDLVARQRAASEERACEAVEVAAVLARPGPDAPPFAVE